MEDMEKASFSENARRLGFPDNDSQDNIVQKFTHHLKIKERKFDFCGNFNHGNTILCKLQARRKQYFNVPEINCKLG